MEPDKQYRDPYLAQKDKQTPDNFFGNASLNGNRCKGVAQRMQGIALGFICVWGTVAEQNFSISGRGRSRECDVSERRVIETRKEGHFGRAQACLEPAAAGDTAIATAGRETFDQRLAFFQQPHHFAQPNLLRRARERRAATTTAPGGDDAALGKALHDLAQVVSRQTKLLRQFGGGERMVRIARQAHEHPQAIVGEGGQAHRFSLRQ